jgi:DNA-binding PadR family transcriptional regulator
MHFHKPSGEHRFARPDHHERGPHRRGGRLARLLEHGDLRLLVLHLIAAKPSHGYEIIKAIEDLTAGAYAPSPGIIYPTLTMLEELGQAESTAEGARKSYAATETGRTALAENAEAITTLLARLSAAQPRENTGPILRAGENLRLALRMKLQERREDVTRKIVDILDAAARHIEEL